MKRILIASLWAWLGCALAWGQSYVTLRIPSHEEPKPLAVLLVDATKEGLWIKVPQDSTTYLLAWDRIREFKLDSSSRAIKPNHSLFRAMKDTSYWYRRGFIEARGYYKAPVATVVLTALTTVIGYGVGGLVTVAVVTSSPVNPAWQTDELRLYPDKNNDYRRGLSEGARIIRRRHVWQTFGLSSILYTGLAVAAVAQAFSSAP